MNKTISILIAFLLIEKSFGGFLPEIESPIRASDPDYVFDGGTYGITIQGKDGFPHLIYLDRRDRNTIGFDNHGSDAPLLFWINAYPGNTGSIKIPRGSEDEKRLMGWLAEALQNEIQNEKSDTKEMNALLRGTLESMIKLIHERDSQQVAAGNDR